MVGPSLPTPSLMVKLRGDDRELVLIIRPSSSAVFPRVLDVRITARKNKAVFREGSMYLLEIGVNFYFAEVIIYY